MKKLLLIALLLLSLNAFSQIDHSAYNSMFAKIEVEKGWAATDLFQLHFYSEAWLIDKTKAYYRKRPGFQANLIFDTINGASEALKLTGWFAPETRVNAEFKMWGQTATARCRVVETTHENGIVLIKITGLETLKYSVK